LDNLTHSLVGLFLARAGFKRATAYGTAILVVAANAPDIDVISWFWGRPTWLHWHRNITHSLVGAPVMALLPLRSSLVLSRKRSSLVAGVPDRSPGRGIPSAAGSDERLWRPAAACRFQGHWSHLDITPVLDFTIWAILLLGIVAPALSRLVGSEIGEPAPDKGNAGWAFTALFC
jgi:inner membrane protein